MVNREKLQACFTHRLRFDNTCNGAILEYPATFDRYKGTAPAIPRSRNSEYFVGVKLLLPQSRSRNISGFQVVDN